LVVVAVFLKLAIFFFYPVGIGFDVMQLSTLLVKTLLRFIFAPENAAMVRITRGFTARKSHRYRER
jgi:hypothetical protein